jgi:sec-independent protein translocase protein TatC
MSEAFENLSEILLALRNKLLVIAAVLGTGITISFQFTGPLIMRMKNDLLPEGAKLVYVSPLEVMMLELKLSIIIGSLVTLPIIALYIYRAISKRYSVRIPIYMGQFVLLSVSVLFMFVLGASYSYFLMLPIFLKFLYTDAMNSGVTATYSVMNFISLIATTTAIFGLVFELPVVLIALIRNGFVKYSTLAAYRKHIYVLILVVAMLITPGTDIFSQMIFAVPMTIFFEISMLIVKILGVKNKISKPNSSISAVGISK